MNENIDGKVVVVTGASSGLGEAAARLLSGQGARLVLGARRIGHQARGAGVLIRTTIVSPGAIATELPSSATEADIAKGLQDFYADYAISADSFARCVAFAISQPDDMDVNEILFRPTRQVY